MATWTGAATTGPVAEEAKLLEIKKLRSSSIVAELETTSGSGKADVADVALGENGEGEFGTLLGGVGKPNCEPEAGTGGFGLGDGAVTGVSVVINVLSKSIKSIKSCWILL